MHRTEAFKFSKRPYAVDPATFTVETHTSIQGTHSWCWEVTAVWFRRRRRTTVACIGRLWGRQTVDCGGWEGFLTEHTDGRYGGDCWGRWDGINYWGTQNLAVMQEHLKILRPMLDQFPAVPPGFDGWWTFH